MNERLKIATFWPSTPFSAGGAPRRFIELVDGLVHRGHEVTLISGTDYTGEQSPRVERIELPKGRFCSIRQSMSPYYRKIIAEILRQVAPDCVFCFRLAEANLLCAEASKLGIPSTLMVRRFELNIENNPNLRLLNMPYLGPLLKKSYAECFRLFSRRVFGCCDSVVFQHEEQHQKYIENRMLPRNFTASISYLPNNSNPSWSSDIPPYEFNDNKVAVMAARLVWIKGFEVVFSALEQVVRVVPDARLIILGNGPQEAEIKQAAKEKDLPVEFAGYVGDVNSFVANSHLLIYASSHEYGSPNVLLEGAVAGVPMLVAQGGRHTAGDYPGMFPTRDHQGLANLWIRILKSQSLTRSLSDASIELAEQYRFDWVKKAEELIRRAKTAG